MVLLQIKLIEIMRALVRETSKEYFRKYEKPTESIEKIMNTLEALKIARVVGIDVSEMKETAWFFELVAKLKLPQNYTRILSEDKEEVIYLNYATHEQSRMHPSLNIIKTLFYETLANNRAVYTFVEKESKLLPFVEDKMLRQCIGINSKRREAQKVNLQRDQNGRMVMSKLQRIKPDIKGLLSSRSYMLKMLVEKVFTRKQILGKGKRAISYANCVAEVKKAMKQSQPEKDEQFQNQENLQLHQSIFQNAYFFFQSQFGDLDKIPARILSSKQYVQSTPENVLKNIFLLNIDKDNIQLYWLARMMDCLPLPPNWSKKRGSSFDSYVYEPEKLFFDIHPSYIYILNQINKFRRYFNEIGSIRQNYYYNMRQLTFYDFFERAYSVDMYGYIETYINKAKKHVKVKDRQNLRNQQNSDWMVLEGMRNSPITPQSYILAEQIQKYWASLDFASEPWCPSISPFGEVVWSSNINEKSMSFNPYKPSLWKIVQKQQETMPALTCEILKKDYHSLIPKEKEEMAEHEIKNEEEEPQEYDFLGLNVQNLAKQREDFLEYYLDHQDKALPWPYELKKKFEVIDEKIYYDQIFVSPFELDKDLIQPGEEVPFWLQKCRAKDHTIHHVNLLLFNSQNFTQIKQKVANYALEMVGDHQPYLLEETQKKINRISNSQQLIKFLNFINDLDMREQRKKEYRQSLILLQSDSDIFGSDISQVEVNQNMDDEEKIEEERVSEESKSVTEKESVKEESESSSQQESMQVIEIQSQGEPQPEPPREQYQFLKNFPKKQYSKVRALDLKKQQELHAILKEQVSKKKRKCKYKQGIIRRKVQKQLQLFQRLSNQRTSVQKAEPYKQTQNRLKTTKNMILTHLRYPFVPYSKDKDQMFERSHDFVIEEHNSEMNYSEITSYEDFKSQIDEYSTDQIEMLIIQEREKARIKTKLRTPSEVPHQIEHEMTRDTIQLQPIYQLKPDINQDPILRHVRQISAETIQFRKTFHQPPKFDLQSSYKSQKESINKQQSISRSKSLKGMKSLESHYSSAPAPERNVSLKRADKLNLESKFSLTKRESFGSLPRFEQPKPFHRVCLESTASHFLGKQAFLRKGDIVTMEARKSLLSKGRGLQTYISKFY